jgi:hypothetical protein
MAESKQSNGRSQFSRAEVQAILGRALDRQADHSDGYTEAQLLETAGELGLTPEEVQAAVAEEAEAAERRALTATVLAGRRRGLRAHGVAFAVVNAVLWVVDLATAGMSADLAPGWHWVVLGLWSVGLAIHGYGVVTADPADVAAEVEMLRQMRIRQMEREVSRRRIEGAVTDVVSSGAEAVVRALRGR